MLLLVQLVEEVALALLSVHQVHRPFFLALLPKFPPYRAHIEAHSSSFFSGPLVQLRYKHRQSQYPPPTHAHWSHMLPSAFLGLMAMFSDRFGNF